MADDDTSWSRQDVVELGRDLEKIRNEYCRCPDVGECVVCEKIYELLKAVDNEMEEP